MCLDSISLLRTLIRRSTSPTQGCAKCEIQRPHGTRTTEPALGRPYHRYCHRSTGIDRLSDHRHPGRRGSVNIIDIWLLCREAVDRPELGPTTSTKLSHMCAAPNNTVTDRGSQITYIGHLKLHGDLGTRGEYHNIRSR
jgi:hypothetical protein